MAHPELIQQLLALLPPQLAEQLEAQPTELLVAAAVGLITLLLVLLALLFGGKKRGGSLVLVAGPSNSGKTTLFYQLKDDSTHNGTVASMQENSGIVAVKSEKGRVLGKVALLDVPGHERLRHKLEQALKDAIAIVFVVDAADITPSKVEAAEELFEVLTHPSIARKRIPILLACNKMDLDTQAHSPDFVRRTIERQLDSMRKTRTTLSPEAASKAAVLGKTDKPFSLAGLRNPISTASISALTGDLAEVHAFLAVHAR